MSARPLDPSLPFVGALIPDFSARTLDGCLVHRRDLKGRRHLVICFGAEVDSAPPLTALAAPVPAWRAERAEALLILPAQPDAAATSLAALVVEDRDGALRRRFGVGAGAALLIADRYGEIVFHTTTAASTDLPLGKVLPILEQLEMRCSL